MEPPGDVSTWWTLVKFSGSISRSLYKCAILKCNRNQNERCTRAQWIVEKGCIPKHEHMNPGFETSLQSPHSQTPGQTGDERNCSRLLPVSLTPPVWQPTCEWTRCQSRTAAAHQRFLLQLLCWLAKNRHQHLSSMRYGMKMENLCPRPYFPILNFPTPNRLSQLCPEPGPMSAFPKCMCTPTFRTSVLGRRSKQRVAWIMGLL